MPASPLGHMIGWCLCCRFVIGREKPGEQSEVAQLIQQTLEQERWQREMMEQRYNPYMEEDEEVKLHKIHNGPFNSQLFQFVTNAELVLHFGLFFSKSYHYLFKSEIFAIVKYKFY